MSYRSERLEVCRAGRRECEYRLAVAMRPGSVDSQVYADRMQSIADQIAALQVQLDGMRQELARWQYEKASLLTQLSLYRAEIVLLSSKDKQYDERGRATQDAAQLVMNLGPLG